MPLPVLERIQNELIELPDAGMSVLEMSHRYLATSEDQIFLLGRKTAREKVASFLLSYSEKFARESVDKDHRMSLPMTRTEIADFLGLTTETVSRVLMGLVREKVITVGLPHSVRLLNVDMLQGISGN